VIRVLGVDGGLSGAFALLGHWGGDRPDDLIVQDTPTRGQGRRELDILSAIGLFRMWPIDLVVFEKGQEMMRVDNDGVRRRQGHMYAYGHTNGQLYGAAMACGLTCIVVEPQTWKRHHHLLGKDKEASRSLASSLWPEGATGIWPNKGHHNRAEAALIARWGLDAQYSDG
jgi:hypothetical protein